MNERKVKKALSPVSELVAHNLQEACLIAELSKELYLATGLFEEVLFEIKEINMGLSKFRITLWASRKD